MHGKRLRSDSDINYIYILNCDNDHIKTINTNNIPLNLNCIDCNIKLAQLIYIFSEEYDNIMSILKTTDDKTVMEIIKYITLLHDVDMSYEVEYNGFYYHRNNNLFTEKKMIEYLGPINEKNNYQYCQYYLLSKQYDKFHKYNSSEYLNTYYCILKHDDINYEIYEKYDCEILYLRKKHDKNNILMDLLSIYEKFSQKIISFDENFHTYSDNIQYKICLYLNIINPFIILELNDLNLIIDMKTFEKLSLYTKYMTIKDQKFMLEYSKKYNYPTYNIDDLFVLINKKELLSFYNK